MNLKFSEKELGRFNMFLQSEESGNLGEIIPEKLKRMKEKIESKIKELEKANGVYKKCKF